MNIFPQSACNEVWSRRLPSAFCTVIQFRPCSRCLRVSSLRIPDDYRKSTMQFK